MQAYSAPAWLGGHTALGAHLQTVYPSVFGAAPTLRYVRERWECTPNGNADGDFIDVDRLASTQSHTSAPMLVVFHGLEGSSNAVYVRHLLSQAEARGWRGLAPHFRGCSGEPNRLPRAYHSGDSAEIDWVLRRAKAESPNAPLYVAAISLGGNATLKWLGEEGSSASAVATAAASISAPIDLMAAGAALEYGFCKVYTANFLRTMKRKALEMLARHPGIFRADVARAARTLREYDNEITAPLHGYRDTDDYWTRASAKPGLIDIRIPTLVLNAQNDPFLPAQALPQQSDVSKDVVLDFPATGGHVGFMGGMFPGDGGWMSRRVFHFFEQGC